VAPPAGRSVGSFEIERELGQGGMGVVYLARQPDLGRRAVLKTLRKGLAGDRRLADRFLREARTAAAIHHPNVVSVYDCFAYRSERYIAQEYVDGKDLATVLKQTGGLAPRVAALVALEAARGLEEIHARGIVHRDLKPSNLMLGRGGEVKIADFGIVLEARGPALTETGHTLGTPSYMSPEQLRGDRVDARSDLFATGVVLYEMLAGRPPFETEGASAGEGLLRRIERERVPPLRRAAPGTPRALARTVRLCLRARPRRRIASATALVRRLERQLGSPAPAECRREIAAWLWERGVFRARGRETAPVAHAAPRRRGVVGRVAAVVALLAMVAAAGAIALDRTDLDRLARSVATVAGVP